MSIFSRRTLLSASALAVAGAPYVMTRSAEAATSPQHFGTAALTAAIVGMAIDGDTGYFVTRGQTPPKLVTVDLVNRRVTNIVRLSRGDGGWAATVSNGQVYAGTYPTGDLFHFDPGTGAVELIGTLTPPGGFVWCLATAPDGTIYAGTSPRCELWEYVPSTKTLTNLGRVEATVQFARTIAVDEQYVYVGTTPARHLVRVDRVTHEKVELIPAELAGPGSVAAIAPRGDRIVFSAGAHVVDLGRDGSDPILMRAPDNPDMIDALTWTPEGDVYGVARRLGSIYRRVGNELEIVGTANAGDETRGLVLREGSVLLGGGGSGVLWFHDLSTNQTELFDLTETEVAGPDLIQSITLDPNGTVHVGGHFYVTHHRPYAGMSVRHRVPGEAKAMLPIDGKLIVALYPSSEIIQLDPRDGAIRSFGRTEFQRPWDMVYEPKRKLVLIGSAPGAGFLSGALTILDLRTGRLTNYPDVLPDQSVMAVTVVGPTAYLAGDTWGGGSATPTRTTAQIAAFDLDRRRVLWRHEPLPAQPSMQHLEVSDGVLYGLYKRVSGTWFAMDLATKQVLHQGKLSGYGEIVRHRGHLYAASNFGDNISLIGPDLPEAKPVAGPLGTSWYTVPQLEFEPRSWFAWGADARNLARFDLRPPG